MSVYLKTYLVKDVVGIIDGYLGLDKVSMNYKECHKEYLLDFKLERESGIDYITTFYYPLFVRRINKMEISGYTIISFKPIRNFEFPLPNY